MKSKFTQIIGFHFISSVTKQCIEELKEKIIEATLQQSYIGEKIPVIIADSKLTYLKNLLNLFSNKFQQAWLNFDQLIKKESESNSLISFDELTEKAALVGVIDKQEVLQSIRFLSDLGSMQYFEVNGLKDKVIINPQVGF